MTHILLVWNLRTTLREEAQERSTVLTVDAQLILPYFSTLRAPSHPLCTATTWPRPEGPHNHKNASTFAMTQPAVEQKEKSLVASYL